MIDERRDNWKKLQYLKAVRRLQYEYRDWFAERERDYDLPNGLRPDDTIDAIEKVRKDQTKYVQTFRGVNVTRIQIGAKAAFSPGARTTLSIQVGGVPKGQKDRNWKRHLIRLGHMWNYKVNIPIYQEGGAEFGIWFILNAEPLRVNSRTMRLWEVQAYNKNNGETSTAYVAQTKNTEKKLTAFGLTATQAIRNAERMVSDAVDEMLGVNERND